MNMTNCKTNAKFNRKVFREGIRDGIPIGLGYFAVAFSMGIAARSAGLTPFQGFLASILNNASAGQYAGFSLMAADGSYLEMALITLVTNARYMLMSCALSQRFAPGMPLHHRLLMGYDVADELFGITIARPGLLNPYYTYGAVLAAAPCWATGTALGITAGSLFPTELTNALGVALYGMFLAVIIPPAKKDRCVAVLIAASFTVSYMASVLPLTAALSEGTRVIILTVGLSAAAAWLAPVKQSGIQKDTQQYTEKEGITHVA